MLEDYPAQWENEAKNINGKKAPSQEMISDFE
jgi:hypothetical protein